MSTIHFTNKFEHKDVGALAYVNQMRMHKIMQERIRTHIELIHETHAPMTAEGIAKIRDVLRFAREEYTKVGQVRPTGGLIAGFKLTRVWIHNKWKIEVRLMYDDGTPGDAKYKRSRRSAGAWARRLIRMGLVVMEFEVDIPQSAKHIAIDTVIEGVDA